jgi:alpha-beta hydrolase superfamily lysophospholipase
MIMRMHISLALFAAIALLGCAPPYQAMRPLDVASESNDQVERGSGSFKAKDGLELFEQWWKPRTETRGVLVIMHGLKDHSARYQSLGAAMAGQGVAVYAFDLRGHGRSAGRRVAVEHFEEYVDDLDAFIASVRQREGDKPVFLFGHSMGGAIAAMLVATREPKLAGLVLSGPALALDLFPLTMALSVWVGDVLPNLGALKLPNENFSRDKAIVKAIGKDPLVYQDPGPARTAAELGHGIAVIWKHVDRFTMPLLLLHGTKDMLTAPFGSVELHREAPASDKTLHIYPGLYHDLLHEPEKDKVLADISSWMSERL